MSKRRPDLPTVSVSDHAVLRWLERIEGVDIDGLRARIARSAEVGVAFGAGVVVVSGGKLILEGDVVVTVLRPRHVRRQELGRFEISIDGDIAPRRRPKGRPRS